MCQGRDRRIQGGMAVSCMRQRQIRALVFSVLSQNMSRRKIILVVRVFSSETVQLVLFKTLLLLLIL